MAQTKEEKAAHRKAYYEAHKDHEIACAKQYAKDNREAKTAYMDMYRTKMASEIAVKTHEYYENNKSHIAVCGKANKEKNRAILTEHRVLNRDRLNAHSKKYRLENKDKTSAYSKQYAQANRGRMLARNTKRYTAKMNRTPKWLTQSDIWMMEEIYLLAELRTRLTGVECHVDHIIPLQGKLVSGLHVPTNLQVIPATQNLSKGNRYVN